MSINISRSHLYSLLFITSFVLVIFTNTFNLYTRYMGYIFIFIMLFILIIDKFLYKELEFSRTLIVYLTLIASINIIAYTMSAINVDFNLASSNFIYMIIPVLILLSGYLMASHLSFLTINKTAMILGSIQVIVVLLQYFSPQFKMFTYSIFTNFDKYIDVDRMVGTIGNPNHLSIFITSIFIILVVNHIYSKRFSFLFLVAASIFYFIPVYLGQSKTGLIAFSISILLLIICSKLKRFKKITYSSLGVVAVIVLYNQFINFSGREIDLISMSGRNMIWEHYLNIFLNESSIFNIVFGNGLHNRELTIDNFYLQTFIIYGIFGLFIYISILILFLFISLFKKVGVNRVLLLAFLVLLILTDFTAVTTFSLKASFLIYFIIGYCLGNKKIEFGTSIRK